MTRVTSEISPKVIEVKSVEPAGDPFLIRCRLVGKFRAAPDRNREYLDLV